MKNYEIVGSVETRAVEPPLEMIRVKILKRLSRSHVYTGYELDSSKQAVLAEIVLNQERHARIRLVCEEGVEAEEVMVLSEWERIYELLSDICYFYDVEVQADLYYQVRELVGTCVNHHPLVENIEGNKMCPVCWC